MRSGHAHGFVPQTLADLGLVGTVVAAALLVLWLLAALRATGLGPRRRREYPWSDERVALVGLGLVVLAYGVQATIDWTWFIPAPTAMALAAAGLLAGSGKEL